MNNDGKRKGQTSSDKPQIHLYGYVFLFVHISFTRWYFNTIAFQREINIELHVLDTIFYYLFSPFSLCVHFIEQVPFL
jgi:hypothetical protein